MLPSNSSSVRRTLWSVLVIALLALVGCSAPEPGPTAGPPPETRVEIVVDTLHGVEVPDPYRWLEDQQSPETRAWIDAQNAYTLASLGDRPERASLERRLTELLRIDRVAAPIERNDRYFLWKKRADDDLWILYVREGLDGEDGVLLDPHPLSPDHTTDVSIEDISENGKLLAYSIRRGGTDESEVRLMDVDTREDLPDRFPTALYRGVALRPDGAGFYYSLQDRKTGIRVRYHAMGSNPADDPVVFGEGYGPSEWIGAGLSDSGRYLLFFVSHGWGRTEIHIQDLEAGTPVTTLVDDVDASFYPEFGGERLFVQTNWEAPKGRILEIDLANPQRTAWKEVVPEREDAIEGFDLSGGRLFVRTLHNVISRIERFGLDGEPQGEIELPGPGTAGTPSGSWEGKSAFFGFESFTSPSRVYRYDVETGETELWSRAEVPFDATGITTEQVWFRSDDGTEVPMFLVYREDLPRDGNRPTLLYGYGGFNVSLTPGFRTSAALWVEHGGVYAMANLRGGGEFGDAWHKAGMLENKQNVFDDFIAAAEWLIENDYTSPAKLAIQGGSNGGLLVGAALTQRPELYRAVLCQFPDLDMVRYWQFENNNPPALLEYGDASDPEQFEFLYAYSPYQRVKEGTAYPAVMLTSGDQDTRVPPLQARKMTARLQAATSSGRPILLRYDTKAGHAGGRPLSKVVEDLSLEAVFLFTQLGVEVE
jgi:prolyl oligopeptidase